jgi:alkaline phosphatase D
MRFIHLTPIILFSCLTAFGEGPYTATGVKVGEVTDASAIVWVRLTENPVRNPDGLDLTGRSGAKVPEDVSVDSLAGACPGAPGRVRLWYNVSGDPSGGKTTDWADVHAENDFTHQFHLTGLRPRARYSYAVIAAGTEGKSVTRPFNGWFHTAPAAGDPADVTFTVITGQMYRDLDDPRGFTIYESMKALRPDFLVATGDTVYYDNEDPVATTVPVARYHWDRMYSLPRIVEFHRGIPGYWMKDDHDTYADDCWPGQDRPKMLPMTFEKGQKIFLEEVPMGDTTYRTFRWGQGLQIWLVEGRDFRSPNTMEDGPEKTIWGSEQMEWLKRTLLESDADWKILISPTPIVGPDRKSKADNHANAAFAYEGNAFRRWAAENLPDGFYIACGDRHWQYHSVDPETGVEEFSCGPASDQHAGGSPGKDPKYHRFHRMKGGFLSVSVAPREVKSAIAFRFHDVNGDVVYEYATGTQ